MVKLWNWSNLPDPHPSMLTVIMKNIDTFKDTLRLGQKLKNITKFGIEAGIGSRNLNMCYLKKVVAGHTPFMICGN